MIKLKPPTLHNGDCLDVMRAMPDGSVDTIVCDPPYGLSFMGKNWDHGVPGVAFWQAALQVAKPGAMLLAFGGTRTHHRLMVAIEDAGWEIRDVIMWVYGSGFPKSHDISKALDRAAGAEREVVLQSSTACPDFPNLCKGHPTANGSLGGGVMRHALPSSPATDAAQTWQGWGTALKPSYEPVIMAMKPLDGTFAQNAMKHGVAGLNIDGGRIEGVKGIPASPRKNAHGGASGGVYGEYASPPTNTAGWDRNAGRWPANLILDDEAARLLDEQTGDLGGGAFKQVQRKRNKGWANSSPGDGVQAIDNYGDTGGASRFFYCAKASRREREAGLEGMPLRAGGGMQGTQDGTLLTGSGNERNSQMSNHHPTVKPLALMRYLVRLTSTPTGGVVLDPFMGSGTTGIAALQAGRKFIGIELDKDYFKIAEKRISNAAAQPALVTAMVD